MNTFSMNTCSSNTYSMNSNGYTACMSVIQIAIRIILVSYKIYNDI